MILDVESGVCSYPNCQENQYLENKKCFDCQIPCKSCSSSSFCVSCIDIEMSYDSMLGTCACPDGKFLDFTTKSCKSCIGNCQECLNSTFCVTCKDSSMIYRSETGTCNCLPYHYFDLTTSSCQSCSETCKDCLDSVTCTSCIDPTMNFDATTKLCTCEETQYFNKTTKTCKNCISPCKSCASDTFCTSCIETFTIDNSAGTCSCSRYEYFNISISQCKSCSGLCLTCNSDTLCTSCISNANLNTNGGCSCLSGFYFSGKDCLQCPSPCTSCSSATRCDSCKTNAYLDSADQFCHCQAGFTLISDYCKADCNNLCTECDIDNGNKCFKCITNAELSGNTCSCTENSSYDSSTKTCLCNSGFSLSNNKCVVCKKYLSQTDIKSASFSSSWSYLYIYFNTKLLISLDPSCSKVFEATTYALLGNNPICSWVDSKTLKVALGTYYELRSQTIYIDGTYIVKDTTDPCTILYQPLSISIQSTTPPLPIAVISGQSSVSLSCGTDPLIYSGERSQMGLGSPLAYSWYANISPSNKNLNDYIQSQHTSSISISRSYFTMSTTLIMTLNVTNFLGYSNQTSLTTTISSESALSIVFDQGNSVTMWYSSSKTIKAKIGSLCSTFTTNPISWIWSYDNSTNYSINYDSILKNAKSDKLIISKNTLPVGGPYTFIASATQVNTDATLTGSGKVSITVASSPLIIQLSKTSGDVSPGEDYTINAIGSKDPDDPNGALNYAWICQNSLDESDCIGSDGEILLISEISSILTIPHSKMVKGSLWDIICTISKDTRSASAMVEINILNTNIEVSIEITMSLQKFSPQQNIQFSASINSTSPAQILWSEKSGLGISISPNYLSSISFPPNTLQEGISYTFTITITIDSSNLQISSQLPVTSNLGASCSGDFILDPNSGTALITMFKISISGCYDRDESDYPLTYTYFDTWNGKLYMLGYATETNYINTYLYNNKNEITIHVCDSLKTCADYYREITTEPYSSRLLETSSLLDAYKMNTVDADNVPSTIAIFCSSATIDAALFSQMWSDLQSYVKNNDVDSNLLDNVLGSVFAMTGQFDLMTISMFQSIFDWLNEILSSYPEIVPTQENIAIIVALVDEYISYGNSTDYKGQSLENYIITADNFLSTWTIAATSDDLLAQSALDGSQNTMQTKTFKYRDFPTAISNKTISLGENRTISFPTHLSYSDTVIMNIKANYYNTSNDFSDVAMLSFAQSGTYKNYVLTKNKEEYVPFSSKDYPITLEMPIYDTIEESYNWTCVFYNETDKDWAQDSCNIKEIKQKSIIFEVYHFSMYKLGQTKIAIPDIPTPIDSESCSQNYAPVYILAVFCLLVLILAPILIRLDREVYIENPKPIKAPHPSPVNSERHHKTEISNNGQTIYENPEGLEEPNCEEIIKNSNIFLEEPSREEILENSHIALEDPSLKEDIENIDIEKQNNSAKEENKNTKKNELVQLLEGHLIFGLVYKRSDFSRKARLFTLATVIVFELFLEGLLFYVFENTKSGSSASSETLFHNYEGKYFGYTILALGITVPIEIILTLVFSNKKLKTKVFLSTAIVIGNAVLAGSVAGIIILSSTFCWEWSGYWAISFLYGALLHIFLFEGFYMCMRSLILQLFPEEENNKVAGNLA